MSNNHLTIINADETEANSLYSSHVASLQLVTPHNYIKLTQAISL